MNQPNKIQLKATIHTNHGCMTFTLFPEYAPKTVENFTTHAKNDYYNSLIFHRVMKDFMIQGGDPDSTGMGGESIWGVPFEDEPHAEAIHLKGALSMANAGPNTNGSQFFIVHASHCDARMLDSLQTQGLSEAAVAAYRTQGGTPWLDGKHTVFGQLTDGFDVLDRIAQVDVNPLDKPMDPVVIESIEIETI